MPVWLITGILWAMKKKVSLLLFTLLWLTVSCDLVNRFNPTETAVTTPGAAINTPSNGTPAVEGTPAAEVTPDIAIPTTAVTQTNPTLRVWLPPEIALSTEPGAEILNAQLAAYRSSHPDVVLTIEQKAVSGQSGILNYLRTGRTVAPSVLPDLIAIPVDQLGPALSEELIYPLGGMVDTSLLEDLFPAALDLVLKNNQVGGYPFVLTNLPHLVYDSSAVTQTIPSRWSEYVELPNRFILPARGTPAGTLGLQLYLDAGGTLTNDAGQVALQVEPLATALQQLFTAKNNGLILDQSSNYTTLQESWQLLQAGSADIALTNSEQFLRQRSGSDYSIATIPGLERSLTPMVSGWAWAISTADPTRRALAGDLLNTLIASNQLGEWSYASNLLPARQAAFAFWPEDDPYVIFAREQLNRARAMPFSSTSTIMTALNNAVFDVITLTKTPQVAAEEAAAALQQ